MSYTNHDVIHAWANWTPDARVQSRQSNNGNCSFAGRELFSYSTCIAKHVSTQNERKGRVVFITTRTYSVTTTGKHMPRGNEIPSGASVWYVDNVQATDQRANHDAMLREIDAEIARLSRARTHTSDHRLQAMVDRANRFASEFGLRRKPFVIPADFKAHLAEIEKRSAAARAKAAKKREADRKERARLAAERLDKWLAGEDVSLYRDATPLHFRVIERDGEKLVESTMGARVPLEDAVKVAKLAKECAANGVDYCARFNRTLAYAQPHDRVGDFRLDRVTAEGTVTIGCHTFTLAEINRAAEAAGINL